MDKIISPSNLSFVKETIKQLSYELQIDDPKKILWLVFGSYVINMNNSSSDLDIIAIGDDFKEGNRRVLTIKNVPIHLTTISMDTLKDDGESRLFGSYFSGKVINPHIFLYGNEETRTEAMFHAGKFIGRLAGYLGSLTSTEQFTESQITSLVFIAYLSTDPSFDSYFLNYYVSPNFENIWKELSKTTIQTLQVAGVIVQNKDKYEFTEKFDDYKSFHSERMKISARHWSYGAVCHQSDFRFQDKIFTKAEDKMNKIDQSGVRYQEMIQFLKQESGLLEIYI